MTTTADLHEAIAIARRLYGDRIEAGAEYDARPTEINGRALERAEERHEAALRKVRSVRAALKESAA